MSHPSTALFGYLKTLKWLRSFAVAARKENAAK
jgi:hypothetical protein